MSVMDSKGALARASKDLFARWDDLKSVWSDAQSAEFEKVFLSQIELDVKSALGALDQISQLISMIENDCR